MSFAFVEKDLLSVDFMCIYLTDGYIGEIGMFLVVSTGGYFGLALATPPRIERFSALMLSEENYTT